MKLLFVNPCLRPDTTERKILPLGLAAVMTFVRQRGYNDFDLLDVDIDQFSDEYIEDFLANNAYDVVLAGSIVTHY